MGASLGGYAIPASTLLWHRPSLRNQGRSTDDDFDERAQRIHQLRLQIEDKWALTFVGENELETLRSIAESIDSPSMTTIISTKFAYWGPMPTYNWLLTSSDPGYSMLATIHAAGDCAARLSQTISDLRKRSFTFVSLGIGDGEKDAAIINALYPRTKSIVYCPIELSQEMLWLGRQRVLQRLGDRLDMPIAIQRDIEAEHGMREVSVIAHRVDGDGPKMYSMLGNTLSNTDDPFYTLSRIHDIMRGEDTLLLETWYVGEDAVKDQDVRNALRREYLTEPFKVFALSGLSQNTDLPIDFDDDSSYEVEVSEVEVRRNFIALAADVFYVNASDDVKVAKVFNLRRYKLRPRKRLRIIRSMRFTESSLDKLIVDAGFVVRETASFHLMTNTRSMLSVLMRR